MSEHNFKVGDYVRYTGFVAGIKDAIYKITEIDGDFLGLGDWMTNAMYFIPWIPRVGDWMKHIHSDHEESYRSDVTYVMQNWSPILDRAPQIDVKCHPWTCRHCGCHDPKYHFKECPARIETGQIADNQSSGGENYDNRLCHCGDLVKDHNSHSGHSPVPWDDEEPIDKDAAFWAEHQRRWMANNCPMKAEKPQVIAISSMTDRDKLMEEQRNIWKEKITCAEQGIAVRNDIIAHHRAELKRLGE